jgi:two-component system response regulator YesN
VYHLLIVDDEIHAVRGIMTGVAWESIGFSQVHCAYNLDQAQEVFEKHQVDVMICDIEMPRGNGIQLLEWVKKHYSETEVIFLTCHADFKYAQHAMHLGCLEFLLKPALYSEVEQAVRKAIEKMEANKEQAGRLEVYEQYYQLWAAQQPLIIEHFWQDLIHRVIPSQPAQIQEICSKHNMPYSERMRFLPIGICIQSWGKEWTSREEKIMEYALRKAAHECFLEHEGQGQIVQVRPGAAIVILHVDGVSDLGKEKLRKICQNYVQICLNYFYCELSCFVGESVCIHEMPEMVERLNLLEFNNMALSNKVFFVTDQIRTPVVMKFPNMAGWVELLKQGAAEKLTREIDEFFESLKREEEIEAQIVHTFYYDFMQMVYYTLQISGLQAHSIFMDRLSKHRAGQALRSVTHLRDWTQFVVYKAAEQIRAAKESENVVERVKRYIQLHLNQLEMSREDIANHVYLNADYLSRLFKKETGLSISDYILQERMKIAKELLEKTDMSISSIASTIGYVNFSHFSKMFKKLSDMTPHDFRLQYKMMG